MLTQGGLVVKVAFLGTGLMGAPMVRCLLRAGYQVEAWNRTRAKAEVLVPDGAAIAESPAAAVSSADIVISILENASVVEDVLFSRDTATTAAPGTLFIDMSSIA